MTSADVLLADPPQQRKYVVVLFADLVGWTPLAERLDPEPLRRLLDRYYAACTTAITEYGGTLEKFIGDAVMAVFGVPVAHEDDALRAVYAATAVRSAVAEISEELAAGGDRLQVHCGIASGEAVVIAREGRDVRVIGDVVNTAARFQSAAGADEIVLGDETARAVRTAVQVEALPPLTLKGKAYPVPAWRLVDLVPLVDDRIPAAFVGRTDELQEVERAFRRATRGRQLCLVNVLGAPGIGKSRLLQESLAGLDPAGATMLRGSCPSHGVGLTYRPLAELIDSLPHGWADAVAALEPEPAGPHALRCLAAATGRTDGAPEVGVEEVAWAARVLVESLARKGPLVLALDDLHWAEPTFLDLVTELATWIADVPVLLLCGARTELLETRPTWGGGVGCATTLELGSLSTEETSRLVVDLAMEGEVVAQDGQDLMQLRDTCDRVVAECGGNPLYATLMVEFVLDAGAEAVVPPTIRSLLGARLDRLPGDEQLTLQRAATIGTTFALSQLGALTGAPVDEQQTRELDRIVRQLLRRRLVQRHNRPDEFRFESTFLRETAYQTTSKEQRASWHLALADRMSGSDELSSQADEELAHHLESAYRLRREVHPAGAALTDLQLRAARALIAAGSGAQHRRDLTAAVSLLERGRDLLPADDADHRQLAVRISDAWLGLGQPGRAEEALASADQRPDPRVRRMCQIQRAIVATRAGKPDGDVAAIATELAGYPDDDLAWCRFHQLLTFQRLAEERVGAAEEEMRRARDRAAAAGSRYEEERALGALCELAQWSPTPIETCMPVCEELGQRFATDRVLLVPVLLTAARLHALDGRIDAARASLATARGHADELRLALAGAAVSQASGVVESLAGAHPAAAGHFRTAAAGLRRLGEHTTANTLAAYAVRETLRHGQAQAAVAELGALDGQPLDVRGQLIVRALRALLAASDGRRAEALAGIRQVTQLLEGTDDPCLAGDIQFESAKVFAALGEPGPARSAAARAIEHYATKGATLPVQLVRSWLGSQEIGDA